MSNQWTSYEKASSTIKKYCAYRERSQAEVYQRLKKMNVPQDWTEELVADLMSEGYLNEWRYAESYVRSKVNQNGWGRIKIIQGLKASRVADPIIDHALKSMDESLYYQKLCKWIERKKRDYIQKHKGKALQYKVRQFCFQKGYPTEEFDNCWAQLHEQRMG